MQQMSASKFKEQCMAVLDHLDPEGIVITKHGKPVAKLVPINTDVDEIFGFFCGRGSVTGDVVSPALSPKEWGGLL